MKHRRGFTLIELLVVVMIIALLLALIGATVPLESLFLLLFGWIRYFFHTLPKVTLDGPNVIWAGIVLVLFTAGLHRFCCWLYAAMRDQDVEDSMARAWPERGPSAGRFPSSAWW